MIRLAQDDDEIKDLTAQVRREVDTLRKCDSPFILRYLGSHVYRGRLWLMTEFCEGGSLLDSLALRGAPLSEPQVATCFVTCGSSFCCSRSSAFRHRPPELTRGSASGAVSEKQRLFCEHRTKSNPTFVSLGTGHCSVGHVL